MIEAADKAEAHGDAEIKLTGLIHRHQLPLYHVHNGRSNDEEIHVMMLDEEEEFHNIGSPGKDEEGKSLGHPWILKHTLVGALESVHFLGLTDDFDIDYYSRMEEDPSMRFVDHMGMEDEGMYWGRIENYCISVPDILGDVVKRETLEIC